MMFVIFPFHIFAAHFGLLRLAAQNLQTLHLNNVNCHGGKILEMTDNNLFPNTSFPLSTKRQTSLVYSILK